MENIDDLLAAATAKDAAAAARVAAAHVVYDSGLDDPAVWELRGLWNARAVVPPELVKRLRDLATDLSRAVAGGEEKKTAARRESATRALLAAVDGDAATAIRLALAGSSDPAFLEEAVRANLTPDPEE